MRLTELVNGDNVTTATILPDTEIIGLTADSREVRPGFLFAALPGTVHDGRDYIGQAIRNGAAAVLAPPGSRPAEAPDALPVIIDPNPRRRLALMAARFFPEQPATIVAVTGTNGKTSVANFAQQFWTLAGHRAAALGTLGVTAPGWAGGPGLTTPDPVKLHETLAALKMANIDRLAVEASSHGLDQYRLDGVRVAAAAITNITRDHLDYHKTMDAYRDAKLRLFAELVDDGGVAVVDADSDLFEPVARIARHRNLTLLTYGRKSGDIRCVNAVAQGGGWRLSLSVHGRPFDVAFPLPGNFQVSNALCALALVTGCGADMDDMVPFLAQLHGIAGRMQIVGHRTNGAPVIVDYAHTPDALATVLGAARAHAAGRLVTVFGCGGDRDAGKRPQMGAIAAALADRVIVTDDNPRSEIPAAIRRGILDACPLATDIGDRREAIRTAIAGLETGDVLVIAGKGHEQGQTIGTRILPFDDIEVARGAIRDIDGATA
ncbi:MAG: UDP-N-acetylmuramoyl-L-alanyl-D-glutamate--2,6-diaminopimelate ligase [Alphaproteobacteria bacterium]